MVAVVNSNCSELEASKKVMPREEEPLRLDFTTEEVGSIESFVVVGIIRQELEVGSQAGCFYLMGGLLRAETY